MGHLSERSALLGLGTDAAHLHRGGPVVRRGTERHTLESLLATRLPDRAIYLGKVGAAVAYGWATSLAALLLGLVTTNLRFRGDGLLLYSPDMAISIVLLTLLISLLAAAVGVLVSLRASTVRQAQQTLSLASLALVFGSMYGRGRCRSTGKHWPLTCRAGQCRRSGCWWRSCILLALDAALLAVGLMRFQRARLITD